MAWVLDHALLAAHDLPRSVAFYERVLQARATRLDITASPDSAAATTAFAHLLGADGTSLHLARSTPNFHVLYPDLELNATGPHIAVTVDDLAAPRARLESRGWLVMAPRAWGPTGYLRLYTEEPAASLVEINQRMAEPPAASTAAWRLHHVSLEAYDLAATTEWFADVLGAEVTGGRLTDEQGHWLQLRTPDPESWRDPARHVGLAVGDVAAVARRLQEAGLAHQHRDDGSLLAADPSGNVVHLVADRALTAGR